MELEGKTVLVTGGAVRLGRAIALGLAEQGASVAISYSSSAGPAAEVVAEIVAMGRQALMVQADFSDSVDATGMIEKIVAQLGQIDVLVNNAAIFEQGEWDTTTEDNWDRHFAINLKGPFFLSQAFALQIKGMSRRGHIVNIADWRGARPGTDHMAYTLTKAGVIAMTKSLALALAPEIQVNAIAPGLILPPPGADQAFLANKAVEIPARRAGSPEEIVKAVRYLLNSDFVTGELISVTGGEHL